MLCEELFLLQVDCQGQVSCLLPSSAWPGKVLIIRYRVDLAILTLHDCLIDRPIAAQLGQCSPCPGALIRQQIGLLIYMAGIAAQCEMSSF